MRTSVKRGLARAASRRPAQGATVLIYHRVGGGSPDERDLAVSEFEAQLDALDGHDVVSLDEAMDRLDAGDRSPGVVLTFDDGFADVHANAWPLLRERGLPFTLYLATGYVGATMHWDGSTAKAAGPALTWDQVEEMAASGLCTVANHTHMHVRPERLSEAELDACDAEVEQRLGVRPGTSPTRGESRCPPWSRRLRRAIAAPSPASSAATCPAATRCGCAACPVRRTDPHRVLPRQAHRPARAGAVVRRPGRPLAKKAGAHA